MGVVVIHECVEQNLRKLAKNEEADCKNCAFAEKAGAVDGVDEYICHAALYDIKTLACYVKGR